MQRFKRLMRLLIFLVFILLASVGVGLSGGIPIKSLNVRRDPQEEKIELIDQNEENEENDTKHLS